MTSPSQNTAFRGSSEERSRHRGDYRDGKVETGLVQGSCAPSETLSKSLLPMGCAKARLSFAEWLPALLLQHYRTASQWG